MSKHEFQHNLAIAIGINNYSNGIPPLQTAVPDANKLAEILESHDRNAKDKYDVVKLLDSAANLDGLLSLLESFKTASINLPDGSIHKIEEDSRLLFYFAGHGLILKDSLENEKSTKLEGYLVPQDAAEKDITEAGIDPEKIEKVLLSMQDLHDAIEELPCRHVMVILDCCFAGAFRSTLSRDIVAARKVYKERYDRFIDSQAWQVITSASHDQKANDLLERFGQREKNEKGHSPFAQALFNCLSGQAEISSGRKDGIITATQLYVYLRDEVEVTTTENFSRQTPGIYPFSLEKHDKGEYIFLLPHFDPNNLEEAPALKPENNPYRGLFSYEESDAKLFFGRKTLIDELGKLVCNPERNITIVIGASGSGKSSLVKAGLIPYLKDSKKPEVDRDWQILRPMRPGYFPFRELAKVIFLSQEDSCTPDSLSSEQLDDLEKRLREHNDIKSIINSVKSKKSSPEKNNILLIIDQFEELTTFCKPEEKAAFLKFLKRVLDERLPGFHIVLTLRSDFEPQFQKSELEDYWNREKVQFRVEAMNLENFREVIIGPAEVAMLEFDPPTLVDRLVDDVAQMPGSLPLLSFALSQLYINCVASDSRTITEENYQSIGEVKRVLSQQADLTFEKVQKEGVEEKIIRNVMVRMVTVRAGELARRRVPRSELKYPENSDDRGEAENLGDCSQLSVNEQVNKLIDSFVEARLMVTGKDEEGEYIEPAHDALVRGWSKITFWLEERQEITEKLSQYRQFKNWIGKGISRLKNGSAVKQQESERPLKINLPLQREVNTSANNWQQTKETEGNREAIGFLWNADPRLDLLKQVLSGEDNWLNQVEAEFVQRSVKRKTFNTRRNWSIALAVMLGLSGLTIAALIARNEAQIQQREAQRQEIDALRQASEANWQSNNQLEALIQILRAGKNLKDSSLNPNQRSKAQKEIEETMRKVVYGIRERNQMQVDGDVVTLFFKEENELAIAAASGEEENQTISLLDLSGKRADTEIKRIPRGRGSAALGLSGEQLGIAGEDGSFISLNSEQKAELESLLKQFAVSPYGAVSYSFDQEQMADIRREKRQDVAIGSVEVFPVKRKKILLEDTNLQAFRAIFSPQRDRVLLISGSSDINTGKLWNISEGEIGKPLDSELDNRSINTADINATSQNQVLAIGGDDGSVSAYRFANLHPSSETPNLTQTMNLIYETIAHQSQVSSILFSPDSTLLATAGDDGRVRLWDLKDKALELIPNSSRQLPEQPNSGSLNESSEAYPTSRTHSDDKTLEASYNFSDDYISIERNGMQVGSLDVFRYEKNLVPIALAFSPDNNLLAYATDEGIIYLWSWEDEILLSKFKGHKGKVESIAFSDDGVSIYTYGKDGNNKAWQIGELDDLMSRGCDWVYDYLQNNPDVEERDRALCDGIEQLEKISQGDKILISTLANPNKQAGVEAIANGDFDAAIQHLEASFKTDPNDPEARIYLNNARIGEQKSHTIAVSVPISSDVNGSLEILRGVSQAQELHNKQARETQGEEVPFLKVLIADDRNDPEVAETIAKQLAENPNVLGVVGHFASDVTRAAAKVYNEKGLAAISPISTSVDLSEVLGKSVFRTVPSDKVAATTLANYMSKQLQKKKAVVFYNSESEYSQSLKDEFQSALRSNGGRVLSAIDLSDNNFDAEEAANTPGAEVLVLLPNTAELDKAFDVIRANNKQLPILAGDDVYGPKVLQELGELATDMVVAVPWHIAAHRNSQFSETSSGLWKAVINWRTAMSYDATKALIGAIQQNPRRAEVSETLKQDNFKAEGATGIVQFSKRGERQGDKIQLVKVQPCNPSASSHGYDFVPVDGRCKDF